jgi:hypothetical protein
MSDAWVTKGVPQRLKLAWLDELTVQLNQHPFKAESLMLCGSARVENNRS